MISVCLRSMTLTLSNPDRLQEQLKRDPEFLRQFYPDVQMQLNTRLQQHGVAMVTESCYIHFDV